MSRFVLLVCCLLLPALPLMAQDTSPAVSGVKETLARGVENAINQLGREDGFLEDPAVRIGLPGQLDTIARTARKLGQGQYVEAPGPSDDVSWLPYNHQDSPTA